MTGIWKNPKFGDYPPDGERVLCIKELQNGTWSMCFGTHWKDRPWADGWVTGGGNNNVILWMQLPEMPEKTEVLKKRYFFQDVESDLKDCVNELCLKCGAYHESYVGACDGCRWKQVKEDLR